MSNENAITLHPRQHDKLGNIYCGVTREGFIAVAGDVHDIADGEEVMFDKVHIKASRKGEDYIFTRMSH